MKQPLRIQTWQDGQMQERIDQLAVEEPLELVIDHCDGRHWQRQSLAVIMRTPGDDAALALGFLHAEQIIKDMSAVEKIELRLETSRQRVLVQLSETLRLDVTKLSRHVFTNSSCGVCAQATLDQVLQQCPQRPSMKSQVNPEHLRRMPETLRAAQRAFGVTGGLHASGLFQADGRLLRLCEDVGRHNALDKIVGHALREGHLPLQESVLLLSGRASFELIQKAALAGIAFVAALGAPSSLACSLAEAMGMTLLGFLKEQSFNIYCGSQRVLLGS